MPIWTYDGMALDPQNPDPEEITFTDIAHALSNLCRFAGHVKSFYSVAEHSLILSYLVEPELALAALFHDAAEAYVADLPTDLKHSPGLEGYRDIEANVEEAIAQALGIHLEIPDDWGRIKDLDKDLGRWEGHDLIPGPLPWTRPAPDWVKARLPWHGPVFRCLRPGYAEDEFLSRYYALTDD